MAALQQFHSRTGSLISLSNNNRTAQRNQPAQEFNNGVVLSSEPLRENQIFEVCIGKKVLPISTTSNCSFLLCFINVPFVDAYNYKLDCKMPSEIY